MSASIPKVVTIREFMTATGLGKTTIYKMIRLKQIPGYKVGTRYVIPRPWFNAFLDGNWTPKPEEDEKRSEPVSLIHRRLS